MILGVIDTDYKPYTLKSNHATMYVTPIVI